MGMISDIAGAFRGARQESASQREMRAGWRRVRQYEKDNGLEKGTGSPMDLVPDEASTQLAQEAAAPAWLPTRARDYHAERQAGGREPGR